MTRRDFVAILVGCGAGRPDFSRANTNATIRLHISGTAGRLGASLAVDEMTRTASLLGRHLDTTGSVGSQIDLSSGSLEAAGERYYVAADDPMKAAALTAWRREHHDAALRAVEWHPLLERFGAEQLNERYRRATRQPMDAAAWIAWMLVKAAVESELRAVPLAAARFDGHKGVALTFDARHRLQQPLCIVDGTNALLGVA